MLLLCYVFWLWPLYIAFVIVIPFELCCFSFILSLLFPESWSWFLYTSLADHIYMLFTSFTYYFHFFFFHSFSQKRERENPLIVQFRSFRPIVAFPIFSLFIWWFWVVHWLQYATKKTQKEKLIIVKARTFAKIRIAQQFRQHRLILFLLFRFSHHEYHRSIHNKIDDHFVKRFKFDLKVIYRL